MKARAAARLVLATESGYFTGRVLSEIYQDGQMHWPATWMAASPA